ncbi:hypothetical protein GCM10008956_39040 [Deinococcus arenae]|uniref:Uncharacterized protein n=1 Tax=Deinococcus arenae TaxID=1452751 RepID=A0A8H9GSX0_9DEIO|nr:hypothetical protein [Deinococcus arenae]GGM59578.1 hypothetical protein GCM10008956_39040 [Deinococcus arenae]
MYDLTKVQNPEVLNAKSVDLVGGYRMFLPEKGSPFFLGGKLIHLGHVRNPTETYTPTEKAIDTAVYGANQTVLKVTTKIEETGAFETASVRDLRLRGLWAGSAVYTAGDAVLAETFAPSTEYALDDLVLPTVPNGHYYKVTTAGTSSSAEPTGWKTDGGTNQSGGVVFTDQGEIPAGSNIVVIPRNHASFNGMLVDVTTSAIAGRTSELFIAPNVSLRGDGYGSGRNGTDETTLKFAYTILSAGDYTLPATLGDFGTVKISGGYDVLGVPDKDVTATVDKIIAAYYA